MTKYYSLPIMVIATLAAACGPSSGDSSATSGQGGSAGSGSSTGGGSSTALAPTVTSTTPIDDATGVPTNGSARATFSEAMDCASLTAETFTLTSAATAIPVPGTVICADSTAVFWPAAHLASNGTFKATITTGARSLGGVDLAANHVWSFTTGDLVAAGLPVDLGAAGDYVILAKTGISTVPTSAITGNLGVSPAAASFITGFSLTADATDVFSTSPQVTGKVYAANYAVPTPSNLTTVVGDMELAFTDASARAPDVTELGAGNIGGRTLAAGVYKWGTSVLIPMDVTLDGNANDVWIFQIAKDLIMSSATKVALSGGALPKNVFWQVAGLVNIGTTAHFEGTVLTQTAVTLGTGASVNGRLLAQTAVKIDGNAIVQPAP
jgi:Ice-binding-like/Bacterial Ig-like domain